MGRVGLWHAGLVQASAFDTVASSIVVTLKIHRYLLVKRGLLPPYKIVSVIFVLPLLIGFLFRDADLHPPYNEIACSEFQDFREKHSSRKIRLNSPSADPVLIGEQLKFSRSNACLCSLVRNQFLHA